MYPENYEYFLTCRNECRLGIDHVTQIMRSTHLQAYGQVLVSQFVGESEMYMHVHVRYGRFVCMLGPYRSTKLCTRIQHLPYFLYYIHVSIQYLQ